MHLDLVYYRYLLYICHLIFQFRLKLVKNSFILISKINRLVKNCLSQKRLDPLEIKLRDGGNTRSRDDVDCLISLRKHSKKAIISLYLNYLDKIVLM